MFWFRFVFTIGIRFWLDKKQIESAQQTEKNKTQNKGNDYHSVFFWLLYGEWWIGGRRHWTLLRASAVFNNITIWLTQQENAQQEYHVQFVCLFMSYSE